MPCSLGFISAKLSSPTNHRHKIYEDCQHWPGSCKFAGHEWVLYNREAALGEGVRLHQNRRGVASRLVRILDFGKRARRGAQFFLYLLGVRGRGEDAWLFMLGGLCEEQGLSLVRVHVRIHACYWSRIPRVPRRQVVRSANAEVQGAAA